MKPEYRTKHLLRVEFIKSGAVLLLALILLISAVFAWFGDEQSVDIEPFTISFDSPDLNDELGSEVVTDKSVYLPCATKLGDASISDRDFANAIRIMPLKVESTVSNDVEIAIETIDAGLHFYIDVNRYYYNEDGERVEKTSFDYAKAIIADSNKSVDDETRIIDKPVTMKYDLTQVEGSDGTLKDRDLDDDGRYRHWVTVIYWADYDYKLKNGKTVGEMIEQGEVSFNSTMSFKVKR